MEKAIDAAKPVKKSISVSKSDIIDFFISIPGVFLGRAVVFRFLSPFAIAYLPVYFGTSTKFYFTALFISLGLMTVLSGNFLIKYLVCILMMCVANLVIEKKYSATKPSVIMQGIVGSACILASGLFLAFLEGYSVYFAVMAVMETFLAFCLTFIFKRASGILLMTKRRAALNNEEIISIAILFGAIAIGSADIFIAEIPLKYFFCSFLLLVVCYKGGCALGAIAGCLVSFLLYICGYLHSDMQAVLAISAITAGLVKDRGRIAVLLGYSGAFFLLMYFLQPLALTVQVFYAVAFAGLAFMLMPDKFYFNFAYVINPGIDNTEDYIAKIKEVTGYKLTAFAKAFERLGTSFSHLSGKRTSVNKKDAERFIDDLASRCCETCRKNEFCWSENFYNTYQTVFSILNACEKRGSMSADDLPPDFIKECVNAQYFVQTANRTFEIYRVNMSWLNKIAESRELVSQQLFGIAAIIRKLSEDLDMSVNFKEDKEQAIINRLNQNKIEVENVIVLENRLGKYEVTISHRTNNARKQMLSAINGVLGRRMVKDGDTIYARGRINERYIEEKRYRVVSGVASAAKGGRTESGDCYSFMELRNGQCLLALSDGMGSGKRAQEESKAAIELLEDFIESGFDKEIAVKLINSVLVLKNNEEAFSTLDICAIDLYTGEAEFIKIGAATTFILREGGVASVKSSSLPIGILNNVDLEISIKKLKNDDIVVMVTDGLLEIAGGGGTRLGSARLGAELGVGFDGEFAGELSDGSVDGAADGGWIAEFLRNMKITNPQDVAEAILAEGRRRSGSEIADDMTVLVAKVFGF